ncbi:MAG: B12-binding domain-containing radical SAM protein, partial [Clostridia bacterium]|nr:B12-binding domain-containing radical SAM protein [Clostridia bacterium]
MPAIESKLASILARVQKPARYLGNEWNSVHKDHSGVAVRMALAFPDLYEIGMSNQGLKILYESVNSRPDMLLERVFAPATDMEELMRQQGLPLFALESQRPLADFDVIGFSLQYELSYTNVLNMIDLSGIPLYSDQRNEHDPLVIGGGPCAFNPEPVAAFFDLFVLGEAEEALPEMLAELVRLK